MARKSHATIEKNLKPFLDPSYTKMHSRPIHHDVAAKCGLPIELHDLRSPVWTLVSELYMRLNQFCTNHASKAIETVNDLFQAPIPGS